MMNAREIIRRELARTRRTRQWLADAAGINLSTLEKGLSGQRPFSFSTLLRVEEALGISLSATPPPRPAVSHDSLGAYSRVGIQWLEGRYLAIRRALRTDGALLTFAIAIRWDDDENRLVHLQSDNFDGTANVRGVVTVPSKSGSIQLVSNEFGEHSLIMLGRPTEEGHLNGLYTALQHGRAPSSPVATPIVLIPAEPGPTPEERRLGLVEPQHAKFDLYAQHLQKVETLGWARLLNGPIAASTIAPE